MSNHFDILVVGVGYAGSIRHAGSDTARRAYHRPRNEAGGIMRRSSPDRI